MAEVSLDRFHCTVFCPLLKVTMTLENRNRFVLQKQLFDFHLNLPQKLQFSPYQLKAEVLLNNGNHTLCTY